MVDHPSTCGDSFQIVGASSRTGSRTTVTVFNREGEAMSVSEGSEKTCIFAGSYSPPKKLTHTYLENGRRDAI